MVFCVLCLWLSVPNLFSSWCLGVGAWSGFERVIIIIITITIIIIIIFRVRSPWDGFSRQTVDR